MLGRQRRCARGLEAAGAWRGRGPGGGGPSGGGGLEAAGAGLDGYRVVGVLGVARGSGPQAGPQAELQFLESVDVALGLAQLAALMGGRRRRAPHERRLRHGQRGAHPRPPGGQPPATRGHGVTIRSNRFLLRVKKIGHHCEGGVRELVVVVVGGGCFPLVRG